ncbi:MAG: FAD-dependent oxidoreductase [Gammaproteobacteria bacterium]|nr:FAD-dependent oxidoreductase [Gammaproteobacteria bacterium]
MTDTDVDVLVLGAGLSGLETALTLEDNGLRVRVLEGRQRVGGRLYTLTDIPGHPEVGGNTVSSAYGRVIAAGKRYGVDLEDVAPRYAAFPDPQELYVGGEHIPLDRWPSHPKNPFEGEFRALPPSAWGRTVLRRRREFTDLAAWHDAAHARYDRSVHDFLRGQGASDRAIALGYETNMPYGTESAHDVSTLQLAFVDHWQSINRGGAGAGERFVGVFRGGNQNLPIAMAKRLRGDLLLGRRVIAVQQGTDGVTVVCSDGSRHRARAVVCSIPFPVLRHVALDPLPPPAQWRAIQTLGAKPITQFHLVPRRPFWESDGLSPAFWTDGLAGSVLANRDGRDPRRVTSLTVWCSARNARFLDRFPRAEAARMVVAEIERLRPAARGALEVAAVHSWEQDPFAGGTWAIFRPGEVAGTAATMASPHGRMSFCGEHTAIAARGMEAAFESAERVSLEVLQQLA